MKNSLENAKRVTMRHEEKYLCPESWMTVIEHRLNEFLLPDKNQKESGYFIRSLYFDTSTDRLYLESLNGTKIKDKFRIRIYNGSLDLIKLEKKTTVCELKTKRTAIVDQNFVEDVLKGEDRRGEIDVVDPVLKEFYMLEKTELLRPKIIVDYRRMAFVGEIGDIRITLDRNIRTSDRIEEYFNDDAMMLPLLPENINLLEVKYNGIFPGYLARLLNTEYLERLSFSKYMLCRNMIINNGRMSGLYEF